VNPLKFTAPRVDELADVDSHRTVNGLAWISARWPGEGRMRISRFLLPGVVLGVFAAPAAAQYGGNPGSRYTDIVPSVRPAGGEEPMLPMRPQGPPMPTGRPPAAVASLEQMTVPQPGAPEAADPVGTLTGQPQQAAPGLPIGSYPSPYYVDGPGCCGPLGRDGRIGYENYTYSGANLVFGPGLAHQLNVGWTIGDGVRSLFYNPDHTAAWMIDLGGSYTHNWGQGTRDGANLFIRQPASVNAATGAVTILPDRAAFSAIQGVHRMSFNFSMGRDVWLLGAGNVGGEHGTNVRVGAWVGGRYGSAHVDVIPLDQVGAYARRQNVFEGFVAGTHVTFETPVGGWILFGGLRAEYGYDWMNLVPPLQGNLNNINLQASVGIRF
jgi:hypothetical protein